MSAEKAGRRRRASSGSRAEAPAVGELFLEKRQRLAPWAVKTRGHIHPSVCERLHAAAVLVVCGLETLPLRELEDPAGT